jgi:hypothetical protein
MILSVFEGAGDTYALARESVGGFAREPGRLADRWGRNILPVLSPATSLIGLDGGHDGRKGQVSARLATSTSVSAHRPIPGVDHSTSDALHIDQAVMRTASDILA